MGRPQRLSPSRIRRMTSPCWAGRPWEKLRRATSMPAATSRSSMAGLEVAGPIVQTTLARLIAGRGSRGAAFPEGAAQELTGEGPVALLRHLLGRAGGDDPPALVAA